MTSTPPSAALAELARAYGVATEYWDWQGHHITVSARTISAVLAALGVEIGDDDSVRHALHEAWLRTWRRTVPPFSLSRSGTAGQIRVHVPHWSAVTVWLELENGRRYDLAQQEVWVEPREIDGRLVGEATFGVPSDVPRGWHKLCAQVPGEDLATGVLVVVPDAIPLPASVAEHGALGLMTQLYSVRSRRSWGLGDLGDLTDLADWSARELGADFSLINPVHAAEPVAPMEPSPYLPTSRRFANPIYLCVEDIPELARLTGKDRTAVERLAVKARKLNAADVIDRDAVWALKGAALRIVHAQPRTPHREAAYRAYLTAEGAGLVDFATWCALAQQYGAEPVTWPADLAARQPEAVARAQRDLAAEIDFHMWLQWCVFEQLRAVQRVCLDAGMSIGVMQDMAVGVHPRGADAWALSDALARNVTVGAPPDPYNQLGQDWSQPPWRPDRLEDLGYLPFRDMVRAALRNSGGLRIDHIIGLFRLWWVPGGHSPLDGTYVRYDHEAMIGIVVLEAERAGALVVGEDLGTVEPWVRDYLRERGIFGTSILWFERTDWGEPRRPEDYRRLCLASVTTHDLPPTAGYLQGEHMAIRERLGLFARPIEVERAEDEAERASFLRVLRDRGLSADTSAPDAVVEGLHRLLSWSPSLLIGISAPDLVGDVRAVNQPGTDEEYPNWRIPLGGPDRTPRTLEDLMASPQAVRLARCVHRGGSN